MAHHPAGVRRRKFVAGLGSVAAALALPLPARAQASMKRIGMMLSGNASDPEMQSRAAALRDGLAALGWVENKNYRFEFRWPGTDVERVKRNSSDMLSLAPDVVVSGNMATAFTLRQGSQTTPIVFVNLADPVGGGLIPSLSQPGGNVTGFTAFEYVTAGKWLELLREIAPRTRRVAFVFGGREMGPTGEGFFGALGPAASAMGVELTPVRIRAETLAAELDRFAAQADTGLIAAAELSATVNRGTIIAAAARHRIPAVYPFRYFAAEGGLAVYGVNLNDQYRRAATYVDRILKGASPATLPVQAPDKFELILNLKTAKAQGIELPPILLSRADEVIE